MRKSKARPHEGRQKRRQEDGRTSIGIHAVAEALKVNPKWAKELWIREGFENLPQGKPIIERAKALRLTVQTVSPKKLDELGSGSQGVALKLNQAPELDESVLESERCVCLALDQVSDPHNLGAVLRSAWLMNASAVFIPENRSVSLTPTVSKVAQGGVEHVPVVEVSPLDQELHRLKEKGFWIFGMSHNAKSSLFELNLPEKVVWVLGAEGSGLRKPVEKACDELVSIPQRAADASFNVSVAAGLAMAESYRQLFFSKASK